MGAGNLIDDLVHEFLREGCHPCRLGVVAGSADRLGLPGNLQQGQKRSGSSHMPSDNQLFILFSYFQTLSIAFLRARSS